MMATAVGAAARRAMANLGVGHSEAVYQRAMVAILSKRGITCQTEVPVPYMSGGVCVGFGRADVILPTHVVELKVASHAAAKMRTQLAKYVLSLRKDGVLVCFDPLSARVRMSVLTKAAAKALAHPSRQAKAVKGKKDVKCKKGRKKGVLLPRPITKAGRGKPRQRCRT